MAKKTTEDIQKEIEETKQFEIDTAQKTKKAGLFSRFKNFIGVGGGAAVKLPDLEDEAPPQPKDKKADKERKSTDSMLHDIGAQLSGLDEQNKVLMYHVSTMRENNEVLLEQVNVLKKNNDILREQFEATLKKNRLSRLLNVIYTILAIGFVVVRIIIMLISAADTP